MLFDSLASSVSEGIPGFWSIISGTVLWTLDTKSFLLDINQSHMSGIILSY